MSNSHSPVVQGPDVLRERFVPFLVARMTEDKWLTFRLPDTANFQELIGHAWHIVARLEWECCVCLVLGPQKALYLDPDGKTSWSNDPPMTRIPAGD